MHNHNDELILSHVKKIPGTFLEIGCWDGIHLSQTYELEKRGWAGVCVDPFAKNFENRKCDIIKAVVDDRERQVTFLNVSIDRRNGGDVSYFSGIQEYMNNPDIIHIIKEYCDYEAIIVNTVHVNAILSAMAVVPDFLSVDTEGSEFAILSAIDFDKYPIDVVMVEHNQVESRKDELIDLMCVKNNYKLAAETDIDYVFKLSV